MRGFCLTAALVFLLSGCASVPEVNGREIATRLAGASGWQALKLDTDPFVLLAYAPAVAQKSQDILSVYIEGDGAAWLSTTRISPDPTPRNPLALKLALRHPAADAAAYLARPCQYVEGQDRRGCAARFWTDGRFSGTVVSASGQALDQLKIRFGAGRLRLIGYSGGGAIAALLAAERSDVIELITVAGNLDHARWTQQLRLTPLRGSMNPADAWEALVSVPQRHFAGGRDTVMPASVARAYLARFPDHGKPPLRILDDFDHHCCWEARWAELLAK